MEFVPAPFGRRLIARIIDLLVCVPLAFVALIPVVIVCLPLYLLLDDDTISSLGAFMCYLVAYVLVEYFLLRRRSGQTLGKGLMGLRVVNASDVPETLGRAATGSVMDPGAAAGAISARSAVLRMAVLIGPLMASLALFYIGYDAGVEDAPWVADDIMLGLWTTVLLISAVLALADRRAHRGLEDFAAGTRVVRAQKRGIDLSKDLRMLVPGKVSLEKNPASPVTLTKAT